MTAIFCPGFLKWKYAKKGCDSHGEVGKGSIDGVSDTDGIETLNYNLKCKDNKNQLDFCDDFPLGVMIVQDGYNYTGENKVNQNFKLVSFEQILDNLDVVR